jgi:cyclic pyranopterin phosphate synthase
MVVTRGYNDQDVVELARLTLEHDWHVRLIELMPVGSPAEIAFNHYVPSAESLTRIEAELGSLFPLYGGAVMGEAKLYRLPGALGSVGFISPMSDPYCHSCNRMRLTADGRIRLCLLSEQELNLRDLLRHGGSQQELVALFRQAIMVKPAGGMLQQGLYPESRTMSQIGG